MSSVCGWVFGYFELISLFGVQTLGLVMPHHVVGLDWAEVAEVHLWRLARI